MVQRLVGLDIGALTIKAIVLDESGDPRASAYCFHRGNPLSAIRKVVAELVGEAPARFSLTGSGARSFAHADGVVRINTVQASTTGARHHCPTARNVLDIGGASLTLVRLDDEGRFRGYAANSQCAAGTGSFLDEQATRLGLTYEEMERLAGPSQPPSVATRCAVFAKSDLIHLQQSGATIEEMWSGLCRSMSQTALQTLLKGKPLGGSTMLVGGVAKNREVLRWLSALADAEVVTAPDAHLAGALGAALVLSRNLQGSCTQWLCLADWLREAPEVHAEAKFDIVEDDAPASACCGMEAPGRTFHFLGGERAHRRLQLQRTRYPSFDVEETYTDDQDNEVRVSRWTSGEVVRGTLGIDIGSTSTKLCLIGDDGEVMVDIYRKTGGDPINANKKLFHALAGLADARGGELDIVGCGTTGSGRKLVGAVVGADAVINEISAHAAGATHVRPDIDTIFEIGGQDSKYMRIHKGNIVDANMNYVCAAGTGSFLEEQARKLGVPLQEVGDQVLGLAPPPSSDRCTVFMEQDVNKLLRSGRSVSEALAAVMRSVVQNYLNKVVGNRRYSLNSIAFQGATARNKGLVAAFETLLGVEVVVSPYCHVMGAWGVALLTQARLRREKASTRFIGLDLSKRNVSLRREPCDLCTNECLISFAKVEGVTHESSWGYLCGRDPSSNKMRVLREYDLFRKRDRWLRRAGGSPNQTRLNGTRERPIIGLPRALATYSHLPMWRRLLEELGAKVLVTGETDRIIRDKGASLVGAEFCFPVKVAHGHVAEAVSHTDFDYVFVPHFVAQPAVGEQSNTFLCPYVQGLPAVAESSLSLAGYDTGKILRPVIDRRLSEGRQVKNLRVGLGRALHVSEMQVRKAWRLAREVQEVFEGRCYAEGDKVLKALVADRRGGKHYKPAIVVIGRPYNVNDTSVNLDLPRKIAEMGYHVIPIDFLPFDSQRIDQRYHNVFWSHGQRIISALEYVRDREDLFAVYLTNFNCGPDSFLLSYAEEIMGEKPMLSLELDEHGADAGYITRIEAFLDVVRAWSPTPRSARSPRSEADDQDLRSRRIWLPPMHPIGSQLFAAAFRADGYDAQALPNETQAELDRGQRVARGCECLPMRTTIGSALGAVEQDPSRRHAIFMPTAKGPCRFGQYATMQQQIFERLGFEDMRILSPSCDNSYSGLSEKLRRKFWQALLSADLLFKLATRVRPYEAHAGETDAALDYWVAQAVQNFENRGEPREVVRAAGQAFAAIPTLDIRKPLVGVVGEIYVRNNVFSNEHLVLAIERAGGEAWMAPVSEWILFTAAEDVRKFVDLPHTLRQTLIHGKRLLRSRFLRSQEIAYFKAAGPVLADRREPPVRSTLKAAQPYLPFNVAGEAILTLGRAVEFVHSGAALIVNVSPFGCMAGTVSAALFGKLERDLDVPVVNVFYDGTGDENARIDVFLANLDRRAARSPPPNTAVRRPSAPNEAAPPRDEISRRSL